MSVSGVAYTSFVRDAMDHEPSFFLVFSWCYVPPFLLDLWHTHDDGNELDYPVVSVPLHALECFEVGLVEAHELCALHLLGMQSHDCWCVVDSDGLHAFDPWRAGWERATLCVVPEHAPEAIAPLRAPVYGQSVRATVGWKHMIVVSMVSPEQPHAFRWVHVVHDPVHMPRRVRA